VPNIFEILKMYLNKKLKTGSICSGCQNTTPTNYGFESCALNFQNKGTYIGVAQKW
jgi:hypothetical protein